MVLDSSPNRSMSIGISVIAMLAYFMNRCFKLN
jgi:hypothetical protein